MKTSFIKSKLFYPSTFRYFSSLERVAKMEVNMKTPYRSFLKNFNGFNRFYVGTIKGQLAIQNRTPPTVYLLPAGEIKFIQLAPGPGNNLDSNASGEFVHAGGYVVVHP